MNSDAIILSDGDRAIIGRVLATHADWIERVGIFGSRALGSAKPASDIDLVLWGDLNDATVARLWTLFDQSSLAVTVDIVAYRATLAPSFESHIDQVARTPFTREDLLAARVV